LWDSSDETRLALRRSSHVRIRTASYCGRHTINRLNLTTPHGTSRSPVINEHPARAPLKTMIRVLSLATDDERRASFSARAAGSKVSWSFYDAKTALIAPLRYNEQQAIIRRGRSLSPAEIACYSSHYSLWGELLDSDASQLLVIEDDALVDWAFIEKLAAHDFSADRIHFLRLSTLAAPPAVYKGEFLGRYLVQYLGFALGTQAYLVSRYGAEFLREHCKEVSSPIDDVLDATWRGALPNFGICHPPVIEMAMPSRIGITRSTPLRPKGILRWRRLLFRVGDKLRASAYRLKVRSGMGPTVSGVNTTWV
jgi:glycosyl transferase family 25